MLTVASSRSKCQHDEYSITKLTLFKLEIASFSFFRSFVSIGDVSRHRGCCYRDCCLFRFVVLR